MITGAGRGLGREFAEEAVRNGDKVVATLRKKSEEAFFNSENVLQVLADVTDRDAVASAVRSGYEHFGRIDVLVNNAGYGMVQAFEEMSEDDLRGIMETNFFGMVNVTREVLPIMREKRSGVILNLSSVAGAIGMLGSTGYCAAKFAVTGFSEALNEEVKEFGISVSAVMPGPFRTDFRDPSSMKKGSLSISDYQDSEARKLKERIDSLNHMQEGDPAKAAAFIYKMVDRGSIPTRLLLGNSCISAVGEMLKHWSEEIDTYSSESCATGISGYIIGRKLIRRS